MNKSFISIALATSLAFAVTPALAGNGQGNNGNGNGNQPVVTAPTGGFSGSFNSGNSAGFDIGNKLSASSGTGYIQEFSIKDAGVVAFASGGIAESGVTVTPMSIATQSSHLGGFAGFADGGKLSGTVQNFAQSDGTMKFNAFVSGYQNFEASGFGGF